MWTTGMISFGVVGWIMLAIEIAIGNGTKQFSILRFVVSFLAIGAIVAVILLAAFLLK